MGGLWPLRPQPLPDEHYMSWLVRLAAAYQVSLNEFVFFMLGGHADHAISSYRLLAADYLAGGRASSHLMEGAGISSATLALLQTPPGLSPLPQRYRSWAWPELVAVRRLAFCPVCLYEDPVPYIRHHWHVTGVAACTKHGVLLEDACPHCLAALTVRRVETRRTPAWACQRCHKPLTRTTGRPASSVDLALAAQSEDGLAGKAIRMDSGLLVTFGSFLRLLHRVALLLESYDPFFDVRNVNQLNEIWNQKVDQRRSLLSKAYRTIQEWPASSETFFPEPVFALKRRLLAASAGLTSPEWDLNRLLEEIGHCLGPPSKPGLPYQELCKAFARRAATDFSDLAEITPADVARYFDGRMAGSVDEAMLNDRRDLIIAHMSKEHAGLEVHSPQLGQYWRVLESAQYEQKTWAARNADRAVSGQEATPAAPQARSAKPKKVAAKSIRVKPKPWRWPVVRRPQDEHLDRLAKEAIRHNWDRFRGLNQTGQRRIIGLLARRLAEGKSTEED